MIFPSPYFGLEGQKKPVGFLAFGNKEDKLKWVEFAE